VPVSCSALSGSSPITAPFLLFKHTRSKGPSLHRHYPVSRVHLTLSDTQMVRHPEDAVRGARLPDHPGPPPLTQITFLACCAHYPGGPTGADGYSIARSRAGFFPVVSAFPVRTPGRRPHCRFRGLLELHTRYGLQGRLPTSRGLFHEASASPVTPTRRSKAIESNHQLFESVLPPLVICPFGAHVRIPAWQPKRLRFGTVAVLAEQHFLQGLEGDGPGDAGSVVALEFDFPPDEA